MDPPYFHGSVRLTLSVCRYSRSAALIAVCYVSGQSHGTGNVRANLPINRSSMARDFEPLLQFMDSGKLYITLSCIHNLRMPSQFYSLEISVSIFSIATDNTQPCGGPSC